MQHRIIEDQRGRNILMHLLRRSFPLIQLSPQIRIQFALDRSAPLVGIEYVEYQRIHTGIDHPCFTHMTPLLNRLAQYPISLSIERYPAPLPLYFFWRGILAPRPAVVRRPAGKSQAGAYNRPRQTTTSPLGERCGGAEPCSVSSSPFPRQVAPP